MSAFLRLAYAEYENGDPLFAWMNNRRLPHADTQLAHERISEFKRGKEVHGKLGTAVRLQEDTWESLLIQTTTGFKHGDGGPQRVVVAFYGPDWRTKEWVPSITMDLARVLEGGNIRTDQEQFCSVVNWAIDELGDSRHRKKIKESFNKNRGRSAVTRIPGENKTSVFGNVKAKVQRRGKRGSDGIGS